MMRRPYSSAKGAATLIVVMMLFLVMALLAAYANRGLLFEQRIAASYARAAMAEEAAEAGIEWTLAQLNGPAVDANCQPNAAGGQRFVDKYLAINPADRSMVLAGPQNAARNTFADCTRDVAGAGWRCRCPAVGARVKPAAIGGNDITPSFGLRLTYTANNPAAPPGIFQLRSFGCTDSVVDNCTASNADVGLSQNQQGLSALYVTIALVSAVRTPPAMPLVVKGDLRLPGVAVNGLGLHNTDPRSGGMLLSLGGAVKEGSLRDDRMDSVPGTPLNQLRILGDPKLSGATDGSDVFKMFMGAAPSRYVLHPALRILDCGGDCATAIETAYNAGIRMVWVDGPLAFSGNKTLGTPNDPIVIAAKGDITLTNAFVINGMVATPGNLTWTNAGGISLINGMVLVGGDMSISGTVDITYQQAIANQLMNHIGSFVRVPGSWIDRE